MFVGAILPALAAAFLFGASTPLAKVLAGDIPSLLLAGLLYLGSGLGLGVLLLVRRVIASGSVQPVASMKIPPADLPWLAGAIVCGGMLGPALLMLGLTRIDAASASLLLSVEGVFTAVIAWVVFKENAEAAALGLLVGFLGYGLSLTLFVVALRALGTARASAYFSIAPFFGIVISLDLWPEPPSALFWTATALMGTGLWLHLRERHDHMHTHEALEHSHRHRHDEHHRHVHDFDWDGTEPHAHPHRHQVLTHAHRHYPDIHHRHPH